MTTRIRILFVTKSTGGVGEYVRQLVKGLDKKKFDITVACLSENGAEFAKELSNQAGVKTFSMAMNRYKVDPFSDTRVLFALAAHIRNERYDLIHAHASKPGFLTRVAAMGTGIPVYYSPHCFAFHSGSNYMVSKIVALLETLAARYLTTKIILVADGEKDLALSHGVGKEDLFITVHTGIDVDKFRSKEPVLLDCAQVKISLQISAEDGLIGSAGRMSAQKAPLDFIMMAAIVHHQKPTLQFAWIGNGPLEDSARVLVHQLNLDEVFHFPGQRDDMPALLQSMDCFVLTSKWEGFPIVLLEAMAAGTPVVATDIPGSNEVIRPKMDGWLVPAGKPAALAEAVLECINSPEKAKIFVANSTKRVETLFRRELWLEKLEAIYLSIRHP